MQHLTLGVNLGAGLAGAAALIRAQLRDEAGVTVGSLVSTGFTEVGTKGTYQWSYAAYPDGFEGSVEFSISGTVWSIIGINDADFGITSGGTSPTAAQIADAVWDEATAGHVASGSFGAYLGAVTGLVADVATAVWAYTTRVLTQTLTSLVDAAAGNTISRRRGDLWTISVTGLGDISTRTKLWFTVKESDFDADTASILQIVEGVGLVYLNGAAATAGQGGIVVTNAVTGALTITVQEDATAQLELSGRLYYDIQYLHSGGTATPVDGNFKVTRDATRSIS